MYQFIETICYENGAFQRIGQHNERCNRTRKHFFGLQHDLNIGPHLSVPSHLVNQKVKCTVTYDQEIVKIEYQQYEIRPIRSLRLVSDDRIDYHFKYADRTKLAELFNLRGQCDDILIVKNGLITDTYYANPVFLRDNIWYSQKNPLLSGTRLTHYLSEGLISPALLRPSDLNLFSEVRIINAMISIEESPVIQIQNISY